MVAVPIPDPPATERGLYSLNPQPLPCHPQILPWNSSGMGINNFLSHHLPLMGRVFLLNISLECVAAKYPFTYNFRGNNIVECVK
jgi:hypothetical protein